MTLRSTMTELIEALRGMTNAGESDYSIGNTAYWSDSQLQNILDRHVTIVRDELLYARSVMTSSGDASYEYQSNLKFYEKTSGGTSRFIVKDTTGATVAAEDWSADYENGVITFDTDTGGASYYLAGYSFDVYAAAAEVWYQKAAHASEAIDFATDGHNIKRSHISGLALKMAQKYESMASTIGGNSPDIARGDLNAF